MADTDTPPPSSSSAPPPPPPQAPPASPPSPTPPHQGLKRKPEEELQKEDTHTHTHTDADGDGGRTDGGKVPLPSRWSRATNRTFLGLDSHTHTDTHTHTKEQEWQAPFFFACLADTQLGALYDNEKWEDDMRLCEKAVEEINKLKPVFVCVCGDLVHHLPEIYPETDPGIRTKQVEDFKKIMSKIDEDIPLLCVCGNHDVGNTPNKVTLERYRNDFGDDYYSFSVRGVRGIVINSNLYYDPSEAQEEYTHQHTWLETQLKAAKDDGATHTLLFTHHPLFLQRDDEEEDVSVLGSSSFITHRGDEVTIPNTYFHILRERREKVLELMHKYGSSHIFCGHWHQNGVVKSERYAVENVITSAVGLQIGQDKSGFRLVKVYKDEIIHKYFSFEEMPRRVPLGEDEKERRAWE